VIELLLSEERTEQKLPRGAIGENKGYRERIKQAKQFLLDKYRKISRKVGN